MAAGFLQTPIDTMRHVLHSKFWTNLLIARFAAPLVCDGGSMTFTSGSGVSAQEAAASYVANEALTAMAQGLGSELGPRVRVNVVAPAFMDTAFWRDKPREDIDARVRSFSQINPLGRLRTPEEVASAYLAALTEMGAEAAGRFWPELAERDPVCGLCRPVLLPFVRCGRLRRPFAASINSSKSESLSDTPSLVIG
jgi:NAD(P)-dependent dehydrogenase (short-subunit alcohol dehydrogenase family)